MSWVVEVESISLDRTRTTLRNMRAPEHYWQIEHHTEPHRAFWVVMYDGWVVQERLGKDYCDNGWEIRVVTRAVGEPPIPAEVLSHMPRLTADLDK